MKAIFLDRDGTLNVDSGYVHRIEDFVLYDGVLDGLRRLRDFALFIVTNQSGIGRGYYSEDDMHAFNNHMLEVFREAGIEIRKIYFSPDLESPDRKPNPAALFRARDEFGIDLEESWVIGDHPSDVALARNAGCQAIYLLTGKGEEHLGEGREAGYACVARDFRHAAAYVLATDAKYVPRHSLGRKAAELKALGQSIVTLAGTFDILHEGHEKILEEARAQGDVLIVAVQADGSPRPFNNDKARARMLGICDAVDYVTILSEKTLRELLDEIRPDVHVDNSVD